MSKHYFVMPLFIFFILLSCFITCKPKGEQVEITYLWYDTAVIEEHSYLKNDTLKHGTWRYYYRNKPKRILEEEIEYKYGKKNGWHKQYREDATMESKIFFRNDSLDSLAIRYYSNGHIEEEAHYSNGKKTGQAKAYFKNGKMEVFNIFDCMEKTMYVIVYDSLGIKIKEEGR